MLFGDDVIHLKGQFSEMLWDLAVFAAVSSAVANGLSKPRIHSERNFPIALSEPTSPMTEIATPRCVGQRAARGAEGESKELLSSDRLRA
jgi:hypothetical protein